LSVGEATFNGNIVIGTAGKGIDFSAVTGGTGTATGNVLDDYEEGTWTPAISGLTLGNGTATGLYTKIGNSVNVQFRILLGSTSSVTNLFTLSGLPFSSSNFATGFVDVLDSGTIQYNASLNAYGAGSTVDIRGMRSNGTYVDSYVMNTNAPMTWTTNDSITANFTYRS
jgi:hypothetical protein